MCDNIIIALFADETGLCIACNLHVIYENRKIFINYLLFALAHLTYGIS